MAVVMIQAAGLAGRLYSAGLGLQVQHFDDGRASVVTTPNDAAAQAIIDAYTVEEEKAYLCAAISTHAKELRDKAVAGVSPGEMASWGVKREEAALYASTGNAALAPLLSAEAAARGVTLPDIIARVSGNAGRLVMFEATVSGVDGKHRDAVRACATFAELAAYDWSAGWPSV